jgi:chemotaxis-related protein WspB
MLMLLFHVANQTYAIDCQHVFEVVPYIHLVKNSHHLDYVSGIAYFEGKPVTVVDLSKLLDDRTSSFYLHTRIIFLSEEENNLSCSLGIIAEKVIEVMECPGSDFFEPELHVSDFPFLDGIATKSGQSIQRIDVKKLFQFLQANIHESLS